MIADFFPKLVPKGEFLRNFHEKMKDRLCDIKVKVLSQEEKDLFKLISLATGLNVHTQTIGVVTAASKLVINDLINLKLSNMKSQYFNYYSELLKGSSE